MANWKKVEKVKVGIRRQRPAVARAAKAASLILPGGMVPADRADVYVDGDLLAFHIHDGGSRCINKSGGARAASMKISIPVQFIPRIPFGTTDVELAEDDGMLILDLNAIPR